MRELYLFVYNVGHGVCTLVHGIKDDGKMYNAVFDCGSLDMFRGEAFNFIIYNGELIGSEIDVDGITDDMISIILDGENEQLDLLVSSHQDADHNNMILSLLAGLNGWDDTKKLNDWFKVEENTVIKVEKNAARIIKLGDGCFTQSASKGSTVKTEQTIGPDMSENSIVIADTFRVYNDETTYLDITFTLEIKCSTDIFNERTRIGFDETILNCSVMGYEISCEEDELPEETPEKILDIPIYKEFRSTTISFVEDWSAELRGEVIKYIKSNLSNQLSQGMINRVLNQIYPLMHEIDYVLQKILCDYQTAGTIFSNTSDCPTFKLNNVILGGATDDNSEYYDLKYFLSKYNELLVSSCPPQIYSTYTFVYCNANGIIGTYSSDMTEYGSVLYSDEKSFISIHESSDESITHNATSTVVQFEYKDANGNTSGILFTGDVTAHNHFDIARRMEPQRINIKYILAPHHGSFNTNIILLNDEEMFDYEYQPLNILYETISGVTTFVSCCTKNSKYKVPREEYVKIAYAYANSFNDHGIGYFDAPNGESYTFGTVERTVFSTGLCLRRYVVDLLNDTVLEGAEECAAENTAAESELHIPPNDMFI